MDHFLQCPMAYLEMAGNTAGSRHFEKFHQWLETWQVPDTDGSIVSAGCG